MLIGKIAIFENGNKFDINITLNREFKEYTLDIDAVQMPI